MQRAFLKNLHPDDYELWLAVEKSTWRLALAANLPITEVLPTPRKYVSEVAGCYLTPPEARGKVVWISLRRDCEVKSRGTFWTERYCFHVLHETIVHEMAHCKAGCGAGHGPKFFRAFAELMILAEDIKMRVDLAAFDGKLEP